MSVFRNILLVIIFSVMFLSCFNKSDVKKSNDNIYVKLVMENDTLTRKEEKGFVKFHYKISDTVKIVPKDERRVYFVLSLSPNGSNIKSVEKGEQIEREITLSPINSRDTLKIPFNITPHFLGKGKIIGILLDSYHLNSYYGIDKFRRIEYEQIFEKEVYIK